MKDQARTLRRLAWLSRQQQFEQGPFPQEKGFSQQPEGARVISITSGKGGVGKTHIVVNLAYALQSLGKQVMIFDADLGLANVDILLGLTPRFNIQHVMQGEKTFKEILIQGPTGMLILPAYSGAYGPLHFTESQHSHLINEIDLLNLDFLLIDTGAGISESVINFNASASDVIVVVSPEPTSLTDAYTLMKILSIERNTVDFKIIVNMANNANEAYQTFEQISMATKRFLHFSLDYLGFILRDSIFRKSVRQQQAILECYPDSEAANCFRNLATKVVTSPVSLHPSGNLQYFWHQLLSGQMAHSLH